MTKILVQKENSNGCLHKLPQELYSKSQKWPIKWPKKSPKEIFMLLNFHPDADVEDSNPCVSVVDFVFCESVDDVCIAAG